MGIAATKNIKRRRREVKPGQAYIRGFGKEFHSGDYGDDTGPAAREQLSKVGGTLRRRRPQNFQERVAQGWRPADETQRGRDALAAAPTAVLRAYYQGRARPMIAPAGTKYAPDTPASIGGTSMLPSERRAFGIGMDQFVGLAGLQAWRRKRKLHRLADKTGQVQRYTVEGDPFPREIHPARPKTAVGRLREHLEKRGVDVRDTLKDRTLRDARDTLKDRTIRDGSDWERTAQNLIKQGKLEEAVESVARLLDDRPMARRVIKEMMDEQRRGPRAKPVDQRALSRYRTSSTEFDRTEKEITAEEARRKEAYNKWKATDPEHQKQKWTQQAKDSESALARLNAYLEKMRGVRDASSTTLTSEPKAIAQEGQERTVDELIEAGPAPPVSPQPMSEQELLRRHGPVETTGAMAEQTPEVQAYYAKRGATVGDERGVGLAGLAHPSAMARQAATQPAEEAPPGMPPEISVTLEAIQAELPNIGFPNPSELFIEAVGAYINGYQAGLSGILGEMQRKEPDEYKRFVQWSVETGGGQ